MWRKLIPIVVALAMIAALSGCGANISLNLFTAEELVSQSFTVSASPHVVVEMFNGGIDVIAGTDNTVKIDVTKRGGGNSQDAAQADLKNVEVQITQNGDTIRVVAQRTDRQVDVGNSGASAKLQVPANTSLELRTSNGGVTSSGPIGDLKALTSNGAIDVEGSAGQLNLTTSNGHLVVNGGRGQLTLETSNGGIDITADQVVVSAFTSNGPIDYTGSLAAGNSEFRTSNSSITLILPADISFNLNADTSNAKVTSEFTLSSTTSSSDTSLRGTVRSNPTISIEAHTSNGNIDVRHNR